MPSFPDPGVIPGFLTLGGVREDMIAGRAWLAAMELWSFELGLTSQMEQPYLSPGSASPVNAERSVDCGCRVIEVTTSRGWWLESGGVCPVA